MELQKLRKITGIVKNKREIVRSFSDIPHSYCFTLFIMESKHLVLLNDNETE